MDIERAEINALRGAKRLIITNKISKWAICVYYRVNNQKKFVGF